MKRILLIFLFCLQLISCGTSSDTSSLQDAAIGDRLANDPWFFVGTWYCESPNHSTIDEMTMVFKFSSDDVLISERIKKYFDGRVSKRLVNHYDTLEVTEKRFRIVNENTIQMVAGSKCSFLRTTPRLYEYGYRYDSPVPKETRKLVADVIVSKSPATGRKLEDALKGLKVTEAAALGIVEFFKSINRLAQAYKIHQANRTLLDKITDGAANIAKNRMFGAAVETAKCMTKTGLAGPYVEYRELTTGKNFCTGEPTTWVDDAINITSLGITAAGVAVGTPIGGIIADKAGDGIKGVKFFLAAVVSSAGHKRKIETAADVSLEAVKSASKVGVKSDAIPKYMDIARKNKLDLSSISDIQNQRLGEAANGIWNNHGRKHLKAKTEAQAKKISSTGRKPPSQYLPGIDAKSIEEATIVKGIKKEQPGNVVHFYHKHESPVGYANGKKTYWHRGELTQGEYHGHPRDPRNVPSDIKRLYD